MPQSDPTPPEPAPDAKPTGGKRKKKKKKRRSGALSDGGGGGATQQQNTVVNGDTSILHSKLSLKKRLFLKKSTRRTPWYDVDELLETGRGLLLASKLFPSPPPSNNAVDGSPSGLTREEHRRLREALRRVALWRGRSERGGRLPHAVDMTAELASALLTDAEQSEQSEGVSLTSARGTSAHQTRNAYASLLLRSVNGLADSYRSKTSAVSVAHACALAGMPAWIVDVRHDASHGELPGLGLCRIAAVESLRFWGEGYWRGLEGRVWGATCDGGGDGPSSSTAPDGICTAAMDCLARYQKAAIEEAREREERARSQQPASVTKENEGEPKLAANKSGLISVAVGDDDNTNAARVSAATKGGAGAKDEGSANDGSRKRNASEAVPGGQGGGPIPWWVLNDDKPKKRKKKAKFDGAAEGSAVSDGAGTGNKGENDDEVGAAYEDGATMATQDEGGDKHPPVSKDTVAETPTARDCAAEFVRTIPIDVAFSTALRFLVWGRPLDGNEDDSNGPALVALPADLLPRDHPNPNRQHLQVSKQKLGSSFDQLRAMYNPLLVALTNAYPGFLRALFVHLADSILCLDEACEQQNSDDPGGKGGNLDLDQLQQNLQLLIKWVRYILSREYHMHFDRLVALHLPPAPPEQDGPESQSGSPGEEGSDQKQPQQPLQPIDLKKKGRKRWTEAELEHMQGPLMFSSLDEMGMPLNSVCDRLLLHCDTSNAGAATGELRRFLEGIIGEKRVVFQGLESEASAEREHPTKEENDAIRGVVNSSNNNESEMSDNPVGRAASKNNLSASHESPSPAMLSLEDMEAMLGNVDTKDDVDGEDLNIAGQDEGDSRESFFITPWTLCEQWDSCAIGTMPGCPG